MSVSELSERAKAVLLLCSTVGLDSGSPARPFGPVGWHSLLKYVEGAGPDGPEALMGQSADTLVGLLGISPEIADRVARLLERAGRFTLDLERISGWGVWVVTEFDAGYPAVLRERLGDSSPPLLFGAGDADLLRCEGVAVVGSRRPDDAGMTFARSFGARAAKVGLAVISGAARGVDETAMVGSLESDGIAVGVVADSLERLVRKKVWRDRLLGGELALVSEHHPARRFDPGWAMQRNRVVYCLARAAVVVASDAGRGGTWDGAAKNSKAGWVPLFVRSAATAPAGNRRMLELFGARELPDDGTRAADLIALAMRAPEFGAEPRRPRMPDGLPPALPFDEASAGSHEEDARDAPAEAVATPVRAPAEDSVDDFFARVASFLVDAAIREQKVVAISVVLGVPQRQASVWLRRAAAEELLTKTSKGYAAGPRSVEDTEQALVSQQAIADAGIEAVERLEVGSCSKDEAARRVAAGCCVELPLANQWLAQAAAKWSQPLFTLDASDDADACRGD